MVAAEAVPVAEQADDRIADGVEDARAEKHQSGERQAEADIDAVELRQVDVNRDGRQCDHEGRQGIGDQKARLEAVGCRHAEGRCKRKCPTSIRPWSNPASQ